MSADDERDDLESMIDEWSKSDPELRDRINKRYEEIIAARRALMGPEADAWDEIWDAYYDNLQEGRTDDQ